MEDWALERGYYASKRNSYFPKAGYNDIHNSMLLEQYRIHYVYTGHADQTTFEDSINGKKYKVYSDSRQVGWLVY